MSRPHRCDMDRALRELEARGLLALVEATAATHGYTAEDVVGPRRLAGIMQARRDCVAAIKAARPFYSSPELGLCIGRDHTTVLALLGRTKRASDAVQRRMTIVKVRIAPLSDQEGAA